MGRGEVVEGIKEGRDWVGALPGPLTVIVLTHPRMHGRVQIVIYANETML